MAAPLLNSVRRHSATGLTERKHAELRELALRFCRARSAYVDDYWNPCFASRILCDPRKLIEERRHEGFGSRALGAHQNRLAMESALALLRGHWRLTLKNVSRHVSGRPTLADEERRWFRLVLRSPALLQDCLNGQIAHVDQPSTSPLDELRLSKRLRRWVLLRRGSKPRARSMNWFMLDTNSYRPFQRPDDRHFRGAWLAVAGIRPGARVCVPLAGRGLVEFAPRTNKENSRPNVLVTVGGRVVFQVARRLQPVARGAGVHGGVDKGYRTLLTLSTGHAEEAERYGRNIDEFFAQITDGAAERLKHRRRLQAYERSLRNTMPGKARRMRRRNLGREHLGRLSRIERTRLREEINRTVNEMFLTRTDISTLYVEALDFAGRRVASPVFRSRLNRWLKGFLHRRLAYKAKLNGVELKVVNAAYTSQTCPRCWFASEKNRSGDRFCCSNCSYAGSADAVAATNVLTRGSDLAITRFMSPGEVKQILNARWRSARIGRAWSSNEEVSPADAPESDALERAANNLGLF